VPVRGTCHLLQRTAERLERVAHPALHRGNGCAGDLRDPGEGDALVLPEQEDLALLGRKLRDGAEQPGAELGVAGRVLRCAGAVGHRLGDRPAPHPGVERRVAAVDGPARLVGGEVAGHGVEPGLEPALRGPPGGGVQEPHPALLGQVLGAGLVAGEAGQEPEDARAVPVEEDLEGRHVSSLVARHERLVGLLRHPSPSYSPLPSGIFQILSGARPFTEERRLTCRPPPPGSSPHA
jgi:hypothetical protein